MSTKLNDIRIDGGTQPRSEICEETVSEYAHAMHEGDTFPPVTVFNDGAHLWLADGFHRYHACRKIGRDEIACDVQKGTRRDAVLYSVSANAVHGLRRSNADKRKAVMTLLNDEEWAGWSDREIARRCGVDNSTVSRMRPSLLQNNSDTDESRTYTTKHGKKAKMKTGKIGRKKDSSEPVAAPVAIDDDPPVTPETPHSNGEPKRKGVGLQKASEAIAKLKEIPINDGLLDAAYDMVISWIEHNR